MYLAWYDADKKKKPEQKINDAATRYREKFSKEPLICLVSPLEGATHPTMPLRELATIGRNCFWIGREDDD